MSRINKDQDNTTVKVSRFIAWLFLAGFILLLFYTYFHAEVIFQGMENKRYSKYFIISLAGVLFWGVVVTLKDEIRANIVMVASSLIVGLYLVEGDLLAVSHPVGISERVEAAAELGIEFDARTKLQVIREL